MILDGVFGGKGGIHRGRDKVMRRLLDVDGMGAENGSQVYGHPFVADIECAAVPWLLLDDQNSIKALEKQNGETLCEDAFELRCSCRGETFHADELHVTTSDVRSRARQWRQTPESNTDDAHGLVLGCAAVSDSFLSAMALHLPVHENCHGTLDEQVKAYNRHTNRIVMLPKGSMIDFNFGGGIGRARWLQVLHGSAVVCMAPPQESNLTEYRMWYPTKDTCFLDFLEAVVKVELHADDDKVLFVPAGWLMATVCTENCAIAEGVLMEPCGLDIEMKVSHAIRPSSDYAVIEDSCVRRSMALYWGIAICYGQEQKYGVLPDKVKNKTSDLMSYFYSCLSMERRRLPRLEVEAPSSHASFRQQQSGHGIETQNTAESPRSSLKIRLSKSPRTHFESPCPSPKKIRLRLPTTREQHVADTPLTNSIVKSMDEHTTIKLPTKMSERLACLRQLCVVLQQPSYMRCIEPHALRECMQSLAALLVYSTESHQNAPMTRDTGSTIFSAPSKDMASFQVTEDYQDDMCEHCDETPKASEIATPFTLVGARDFDDRSKSPEKRGTSHVGVRAPITKRHASAKQRLAKKLGIKA